MFACWYVRRFVSCSFWLSGEEFRFWQPDFLVDRHPTISSNPILIHRNRKEANGIRCHSHWKLGMQTSKCFNRNCHSQDSQHWPIRGVNSWRQFMESDHGANSWQSRRMWLRCVLGKFETKQKCSVSDQVQTQSIASEYSDDAFLVA